MQRKVALLLVGVVLLAGVAAAPAAAQTNESDTGLAGELFGSTGQSIAERAMNDPLGFASEVTSAARGMAAGASPFGADRSTSECAADYQSEINNNAAAYETYINNRTNASTDTDVVAVHCTAESEGLFNDSMVTSTIYLTADVNKSGDSYTYENLTAVDDTNRTVDEELTQTGTARNEGPDDLVTFRKKYVEQNKTPPRSYVARMGGKYRGDVTGTFGFLPDDE